MSEDGLWSRFFHHIVSRRRKNRCINLSPNDERSGNIYLPQLREILEYILRKKKISYEQFIPIILDGSDSKASLAAIKLLSRDLNRLIILTDHAAYFEKDSERLYEEQGLIAEIFPKTSEKIAALQSDETPGNVILDFEELQERTADIKFGRKIYIPVFKKAWESAGNLDITVPIGYNTVIVKDIKTVHKQPCLDKFEQAFYENE